MSSFSKVEFDKDLAVRKFQEYVRINSAHPDPDYDSVVKFLCEYAEDIQVDVKCIEVGEHRNTVVLMCWPGNDPTLPSILLYSHTDVGAVVEENWKYDPWQAVKYENGDIYGRGTQDMKNVAIQYLEAIRMLKKQHKEPLERTIYLSFMPEEHMGGVEGMQAFVETPEFKAMNVGLALDEGLANPENKYSVFYAERSAWWICVGCKGNPGAGSRIVQNTVIGKLRKVMNSFLDFGEAEEERLKAQPCMFQGDFTSVNLTMLEGGVQPNVVPEEFCATFDIRIPPSVDTDSFETMIGNWCRDAGKGVSCEFIQKNMNQRMTKADDDNPWWRTFMRVLKKRGVEVLAEIFSAFTDGRFLRAKGYPVIGFSPMRNTPIILNENNEFINDKVFLEGIEVYSELIPALANGRF